MSRLIIPAPGVDGSVSVAVPSDAKQIAFPENFALSGAERVDNSLVLQAESGAKVTLTDFFVSESKELPDLQLADGSVVSSSEFLRGFNPDLDLTTAAGPSTSSIDSSGGQYADDTGALIGGVDRLGNLGRTGLWGGARSAGEEPSQGNLLSAEVTSGPGGGENDGGEEPEPAVPLYYKAAIMDVEDGADASVITRLLDASGNPVSPPPASITVTGADSYGWEYDPATGSMKFFLKDGTPVGTPENVTINYGSGDGAVEYVVQLSSSNDEQFNALPWAAVPAEPYEDGQVFWGNVSNFVPEMKTVEYGEEDYPFDWNNGPQDIVDRSDLTHFDLDASTGSYAGYKVYLQFEDSSGLYNIALQQGGVHIVNTVMNSSEQEYWGGDGGKNTVEGTNVTVDAHLEITGNDGRGFASSAVRDHQTEESAAPTTVINASNDVTLSSSMTLTGDHDERDLYMEASSAATVDIVGGNVAISAGRDVNIGKTVTDETNYENDGWHGSLSLKKSLNTVLVRDSERYDPETGEEVFATGKLIVDAGGDVNLQLSAHIASQLEMEEGAPLRRRSPSPATARLPSRLVTTSP